MATRPLEGDGYHHSHVEFHGPGRVPVATLNVVLRRESTNIIEKQINTLVETISVHGEASGGVKLLVSHHTGVAHERFPRAGLALALFADLRVRWDFVGRRSDVATVAVAESIAFVLIVFSPAAYCGRDIHHSGQEKMQAESSAT